MEPLAELLGDHPALAAVRREAGRLLHLARAGRLPPVLIEGETGTGKGLLAHALHRHGPRAHRPFVDLNCAAIPESLLEAELFGFERGAFTGADRRKPGLLQAAHQGTLFLDEIALLPLALQAKLLKAIDEQRIRPLGGTRPEVVDVWILAATSTPLDAAVRARRFRADLYHRLAVLRFQLPPLRARGDDIRRLAHHLLERLCEDHRLPRKRLTPDAERALRAHRWPGNVRELTNVLERAVLLTDGDTLDAAALALPATPDRDRPETESPGSLRDDVGQHERDRIAAALARTGGNISRAAALLGLPRNSLRYRIAKYRLEPGAADANPPPVTTAPPLPAPTASVAPAASTAWRPRLLAFLAAHLDDRSRDTRGSTDALAVISEKVTAFGGRVEEIGTTTLLAVFGLEAAEDSARRAAHAALAVLRAAGQARDRHGDRAPAVRVGIHVGDGLLATVGDRMVIDRAVRHHASERLQRLADGTEPGTIAVTAEAVPFLVRRFDVRPAGQEYRLQGPDRLRFEPGLFTSRRLVGRELELRQLEAALADTIAGRGRVVAILGEPGIGKSRLLHEFRRQLPAAVTCLEAAAASYWSTVPYVPVAALVRQFLGIAEGDSTAATGAQVEARLHDLGLADETVRSAVLMLLDVVTPEAAFPTLGPQERRARTLAALKRSLLFGTDTPLVMVVEDLHWADPETIAVLEDLASGLAAVPRLLCLSYRPEFQNARLKTYATQLVLRPLPPSTAGELLAQMIGDDAMLTEFRRLLLERVDGNPFFLEECVRDAVERGVLVREGAAYRLGTGSRALQPPPTVQAVLADRIDRLPPGERRLLQIAAVIGHRVPGRLLATVAELPEAELATHLAALGAAEFLLQVRPAGDADYTFKHWLTRDVAYAGLPDPERRRTHRRLLDLLEASPERTPDLLAYHAVRAEVWDKAVDYLREAGASAYARGALDESVERYGEALRLLSRLPASADTLRRAIDVRIDHELPLVPMARFSRLLELGQEAEDLARQLDDPRRLGLVLTLMAKYWFYHAEHRHGIRCAEQALDVATSLDDASLHIVATHLLAMNRAPLGDIQTAIDLWRSIADGSRAELAKRVSYITGSSYIASCGWLALWLASVGRFREALEYGHRAIRAGEALDHRQGLAFACLHTGQALLVQGELAEARHWYERSLDLAKAHGFLYLESTASLGLGLTLAECGRPAEGLPFIEKGLALQRRMATRYALSNYHATWTAALLLDGRVREARHAAEQALHVAVAAGERAFEARALLMLGRAHAVASPPDVESAAHHYERARTLADELGMRPTVALSHFRHGQLCRRIGDHAAARDHLTAAATLFREMEMRSRLAQAEAEFHAEPRPR